MILIGILACGESPLVTDAETASYAVSLNAETWLVGENTLSLHVVRLDDDSDAEGLSVTVESNMSSMSHGSQTVDFTDVGLGVYEGEFDFEMAGIWELDGTVDDETFELVVEAR